MKTYFTKDLKADLADTLARHGATLERGKRPQGEDRQRLVAALREFMDRYSQVDTGWLATIAGVPFSSIKRLIYH